MFEIFRSAPGRIVEIIISIFQFSINHPDLVTAIFFFSVALTSAIFFTYLSMPGKAEMTFYRDDESEEF